VRCDFNPDDRARCYTIRALRRTGRAQVPHDTLLNPMRIPPPYDRMLVPVYLPTFLMAASQEALLLLLPLYVLDLGGGVGMAALIVGLRGVGVLLFDVPAGMLAARYGDRPVLLGGLGAILLGMVALTVLTELWLLALFALPLGAGHAAWMLGRQSYIADTLPGHQVGRAIAVLAGLQRIGALVGPAAGGLIAALYSFEFAFAASAAFALIAAVLVFVCSERVRPGGDPALQGLAGTAGIVRDHARAFLTAGIGCLTLQLMRSTRQLLVPLFGQAIGLDVAAIGAIYSLSAAVDMSLFYPVGVIVDRWGRRATAAPSMVLFAIGLVSLAYVTDFYGLLFAGLVLGFANGLSTGIVMIIGSDLAQRSRDRGQFLGVWRLIGDLGISGGPLLIGAMAQLASLAVASLTVAVTGLAGALIMWFLVPETLRRAVSSRPGRESK
jgi:MFS family permease